MNQKILRNMLTIMISKLSVLFLSFLMETHGTVEFPSNMNEIVELGRKQYISMNEKLLKYGECWESAVYSLHEGCQQLTEDSQTSIALMFTDCFLSMSGHKTYNCNEVSGITRKQCMQSMSNRAFNAFTEFFTHTQNICFYLKSQIWHEETEGTINRLSFASDKAANQLEELIDNSMNLKHAIIDSHSNLKIMMAEFQIAASEQQRLLFDVFDRLSSLQEWAVGEISWLDTAVFYLCGLIVSHILTGTPRTQSARFFLFLAFTVNILAERYLCQYFIEGSNDKINSLNMNLSWWVWLCRKILIVVCIFILSLAVCQYQDYNIMNHTLLVQIQQQNLKLLSYLERVKMLESTVATVSDETSVNINSDCKVLEYTAQKCKPEEPTLTPSKLPHSPRTTAAVLRKTEQVIQSALHSNFSHLDIVHQSTRSNSPALSHISTRSSASTTSQSRRRKLKYDVESPRTRYNLRNMRLEEQEELNN